MRVCCEKILYPPGSPGEQEIFEHPNIKIGEIYVVLQIFALPGHGVEVGILDHHTDTRGQWPVQMFVTTDVTIPANFGIRIYDDNRIPDSSPKLASRREELTGSAGSTREEGLAAVADYHRELEVILAES